MVNIPPPEFNAEVLATLRLQNACAERQVAKAIGVSHAEYQAYESGQEKPADKIVSALARYFRTRELVFYRKTLPKPTKSVEFRQQQHGAGGDPGEIVDAVRFAIGVQELLNTVANKSETWRYHGFDRVSKNEDAEKIGESWRKLLRISDKIQTESKSDSQFFTYFRSRIESLGISVLVHSIKNTNVKGMTVGSNEDIPIILINSFRQQKKSRTFSLAHEFGHILVGNDGISNPYDADSPTERFCNRFAASLLMPMNLIKDLIASRRNSPTTNASVKWLSNKLKVSMEAIVIRLQESGLAPGDFWKKWKSQFSNSTLPSEVEEGGGGGADQGIVKLARLGFLFGNTVPARYREKGLTSTAVFRASRLKPKYFDELQSAALAQGGQLQPDAVQ